MQAGSPRMRRWRRGGDSGATAVEFALIVPILIVLVFGIIDFGALFGQQLALNHAVREGARAAVVAGTGQDANVTGLVRNAVSGIAMNPDDVAVTGGTCAGPGVGQDLTVTASYVAEPLLPLPIPNFDTFPLEATAVFRCEW